MTDQNHPDDATWKEKLTPDQYHITREKGTEPAFSGCFWNHKGQGLYRCVCCGQALFVSDDKYDSGSGWPSFTRPSAGSAIKTEEDQSYGMKRTEITCGQCDAHLGHVFPDGPTPGGLRYCINSASLDFEDKA